MVSDESPPGESKIPEPQNGKSRLYDSASAGLKSIHKDYLYWTGKLTDSSFQLSLALIAGNWAAFGSLQKILNNSWAKSSLALVIVTLALSLLGANLMGRLHHRQVNLASKNPTQWEKEYESAFGHDAPWPSTKTIDVVGLVMREIKTWLPIASGLCFLVALFTA